MEGRSTVPLKCKLTVSTRNSILDPRSFRWSRIEFRGSRTKFRGSSFEFRDTRRIFRGSRTEISRKRLNSRKQNNWMYYIICNFFKVFTFIFFLVIFYFLVHFVKIVTIPYLTLNYILLTMNYYNTLLTKKNQLTYNTSLQLTKYTILLYRRECFTGN